MSTLVDLWYQQSVFVQDALLLAGYLIWPVVILSLIQRRYRLAGIVAGLLRRHIQAAMAMVLLIALASAVTVVFSIQERAVKFGSARASDPFDLIVAAPASNVDVLLATIYLQPTALPLLSSDVLSSLRSHPDVAFAAPVGFGDRVAGYPLVGTTNAMLSHLADMPESTWFTAVDQAVVGNDVPLVIGDSVHSQHGHIDADAVEHDVDLVVVKRLPATGTRWDSAVIVPIESMWKMHGLGVYNLAEAGVGRHTPGVPAIVVSAINTGALYQLRQQYNSDSSMAFFPAEVLSRLYTVLGSVAGVVRVLTLLTQLLVVLAVMLSVFILMRSMASRFATLHALGAPRIFRFSLVWAYVAILVMLGIVVGLFLGWVLAVLLADTLSAYMKVPVLPVLTFTEWKITAVFLDVTLLLAILPAWLVSRQQRSEQLFS